MVGGKESMTMTDDAVPVGVGIACKCNIKAVLEPEHARHRIAGRRVHSNFTVPINSHESEPRVDCVIDDLEVEPVALGDGFPVVNASAAERSHFHKFLPILH